MEGFERTGRASGVADEEPLRQRAVTGVPAQGDEPGRGLTRFSPEHTATRSGLTWGRGAAIESSGLPLLHQRTDDRRKDASEEEDDCERRPKATPHAKGRVQENVAGRADEKCGVQHYERQIEVRPVEEGKGKYRREDDRRVPEDHREDEANEYGVQVGIVIRAGDVAADEDHQSPAGDHPCVPRQ